MGYDITPRVFVNKSFQGSQFVEMRYVRVSDERLTVALLFVLFEEASSGGQLRTALRTHTLSPALDRYLKASANRKDHTVLSEWHRGSDFLSELSQWWNEIAARHQTSDPVDILRSEFNWNVTWNEDHTRVILPTNIQILQGVEMVILYQYYCEDSFREAECGHLHLKCSLLQQLHRVTQKPLFYDDFSKLEIPCSVNGCQRNLSSVCRDLSLAAPLESSGGQRAVKNYCQRDHANRKRAVTPSAFHCDHGMCRNCVTVLMLCAPPYCCPCCQALMRVAYLADLRPVHEVPGISPRQILLKCEKCQMDLELQYFSQSADLVRPVCEDCLHSQPFSSVCRQPTQDPALEKSLPPVQSSLSRSCQANKCERCGTRGNIHDFSICCKLEHKCFYCDNCADNFSPDSSLICAQCGKEYNENEMTRLATLQRKATVSSAVCLCCKQEKEIRLGFSILVKLAHWWKCRVCDECFKQFARVESCFLCGNSFSQEDLNMISQLLEQSSQLPPTVPLQRCLHCSEKRELEWFSVQKRANHACKVCDNCIIYTDSRNSVCPLCNNDIYELEKPAERKCSGVVATLQNRYQTRSSERIDFSSIKQQSTYRTSTTIRESILCSSCKQPVSQFKRLCPNGCLCGRCLLTRYFLEGSLNCPRCKSLLPALSGIVAKCAGCFRPFTEKGLKVAAICRSGCLLCVLCILIIRDDCYCVACRGSVKVESVANVEATQKRHSLGCYCDSLELPSTNLGCLHTAHIECVQSCVRCRICKQELQSLPSEQNTNISNLAY